MLNLILMTAMAWAFAPQEQQEPIVLKEAGVELHGVHFLNENGRANTGPWVLLTHGLHSNYFEFENVAKELTAAGYDVYAFNFRGHGNGPERSRLASYNEGDYRLEHMARVDLPMMLRYVQSRNSAQGHIVGHSMGGMVPRAAIALGTLDQSRLKSVVLMGSPPHFHHGIKSPLLKPLEHEVYRGPGNELIGLAHTVEEIENALDLVNIVNPLYWLLKAQVDVLRSILISPGKTRALTKGIPKDIVRSFNEFQTEYPYEELQLQVPALYVIGESDVLVASEDIAEAAKLQSKDAGYWFLRLKGVGHLSLVAARPLQSYGRYLLDFLARPESLGPKNETVISLRPGGCESIL